MVSKESTQNLEEALESVQNHLEAGNQRIVAWYSEGCDSPENFPELETAPHQSLMNQSAALHSFAADLMEDQVTMGDPQNNVELVLYGVGMERLLSGVHLKLDSDGFIKSMEEEGRTPSFQDCKSVLITDVSTRIPSEQCGILVLVLKILWELRNNEMHLGYHSYQPYQVPRLFLEASCLIQQLYADAQPQALKQIQEKIKARRAQRPPSAQTIDFDLTLGCD